MLSHQVTVYEDTDLFNEGACNDPPTTLTTGYTREGGEGVKGGEVVTPVVSVTHKVDGEEIFTLTFNNVQVLLVMFPGSHRYYISCSHIHTSSASLQPTHTHRPDQKTVCYVQDGTIP